MHGYFEANPDQIEPCKIFDREKEPLAAEYKSEKITEENRYKEAMDRECQLYKTNIAIITERYEGKLALIWDKYHEAGGRWDWDKKSGSFSMGSKRSRE